MSIELTVDVYMKNPEGQFTLHTETIDESDIIELLKKRVEEDYPMDSVFNRKVDSITITDVKL